MPGWLIACIVALVFIVAAAWGFAIAFIVQVFRQVMNEWRKNS